VVRDDLEIGEAIGGSHPGAIRYYEEKGIEGTKLRS
jgi:hypothetical protein